MEKTIVPQQATPPANTTQALLAVISAQGRLLARISDTLDQIASNTAPASPNYRKPYADYPGFDWTTLGAVVTATDGDGAAAVEWNGYDYTRRAGTGKYGRAIWFSRPTGKDAEGNNTYVRLVTFKDYTEAEPLPAQAQTKAPPAKVVIEQKPANGTAASKQAPPPTGKTLAELKKDWSIIWNQAGKANIKLTAIAPDITPEQLTARIEDAKKKLADETF